MMEERSSTTPVTPDNNMEQQLDIQEGYTASGQRVIQESRAHPVQETCDTEAISPRPACLISNAPHQHEHESSNTSSNLAIKSENFSEKGNKIKSPEETSDEGDLVIVSELATNTVKELIKHFQKENIPSNVDQVFPPSNKSPKTDNSLPQVATEDNSTVKELINRFQKGDIPSNVDQVIPPSNKSPKTDNSLPQVATEDNSTVQELTNHFQIENISSNVDQVVPALKHSSRIGEGLTLPCISTAFGNFYVRDVHTLVPYLSPGDLLAIRRFWGLYYHYIVYIGDENVVHRTGGSWDWLCLTKGRIKKDKLVDVIQPGDVVRIENGTWENKEPLPTQDIIERAKSKIGEKGFNLLLYNCEHFAHCCRYGETFSQQANNLLVLFMLLGILVMCILVVITVM